MDVIIFPVTSVARQLFGYVFFYKSYLNTLGKESQILWRIRRDVQDKCDRARRNGEIITSQAISWLNAADEILERARRFLDDEQQRGKGCFYPGLGARHAKGRKAMRITWVIREHREMFECFGDPMFYRLDGVSKITSSEDYISYESRDAVLEEILEALCDDRLDVIGVYGMAGVGKTMLVKEVFRQAVRHRLFQDVAMVTVSREPSLKRIQAEIADMLGMELDEESSVEGRAIRLYRRLKADEDMILPPEGTAARRNNHVLVILDDLWQELNLDEVGIPRDRRIKLLLTSRSQYVLSEAMGSQCNFQLDVLSREEAVAQFEKEVGVELDPNVKPTALEIVDKCSGLPLAVSVLASVLKDRHPSEWRAMLDELNRGTADVYSEIELSINDLRGEELKSLFFLCALVGDSTILIQDLLYYSMGLGLLEGTHTVRKARDKLNQLLHDLEATSLLLGGDGDSSDDIIIHDAVRDIAIKMASESRGHHVIYVSSELEEFRDDKLRESKALSFPYVNIAILPQVLECPKLEMFLYKVDQIPPMVPDSFFRNMKELKVLGFTGGCFTSLPPSIQFLENLRTLRLDGCSVDDIRLIGKLKQLWVLNLRNSTIAHLPREIRGLTELRSLDVSGCSMLKFIEPNVLGNLIRLEELHMKGSSFMGWQSEEKQDRTNASLSELKNLFHLRNVDLRIPDATITPEGLALEKLVEYNIQIGDGWDWSSDYGESRTVKIKLDSGINLKHKWVQTILRHTQDLCLDGLKGEQKSIHDLCSESFHDLKHLHVRNSSSIRYILKWFPCTTFTIVESLFLENLSTLEKICHGPLMADSLRVLRVIKIKQCGNLRNVFYLSWLKGLLQLEEIEVSDCEMMQEIITADVGVGAHKRSDERVINHKLRCLTLHSLPYIMRFCDKVNPRPSVPMRNSLEITIEDDFTDTAFFNEQHVTFPQLELLKLHRLPKMTDVWNNQFPTELSHLKYLEVQDCESLLHVIQSKSAMKLQNLETITVASCGLVQEVFDLEELDLNGESTGILAQLNELELTDLPSLRCIWRHYPQETSAVFGNLNHVKVERCNSLRYLFTATTFKAVQKIREIHLADCEEMEKIISEEGPAAAAMTESVSFKSLTKVSLRRLPNLVGFAWDDQLIECPFLNELEVEECPKMRPFFIPKPSGSLEIEEAGASSSK